MWLFGAHGAQGREIEGITWALLILSVVVVAIITALVLAGVVRKRWSTGPQKDAAALRWIVAGLVLTTFTLLGFVFWTVQTLASIEARLTEPTLTVDVIGHQFWWELRYPGEDGGFTTANEIHIPVGEAVRFRLTSDDVIHSFWVPALGGKTDLIPGQVNETWLEADEPGIYVGQCAEYCGLQHAHMAFRVVANLPEDFAAWRDTEARGAAPGPDEGRNDFVEHCGKCHTVRGVNESKEPGPDLTHLMSRGTLAAGMLPNTPGYLAGWITNPEALKPGTTMPTVDLTAGQLNAVRAWLATLQ